MLADRILETPLHAARFVSLIPFQRLEAVGKERVEVWHSCQSFLSRVSNLSYIYLWFRVVETLKIMQYFYAIFCSDLVLKLMCALALIRRALMHG